MPRWTREPNADQRIKLVITGFKNGLHKSREDAVKSHGVDPNTLRRRLNGKHKSHKIVHIQQQRLLPPAESAVVRQCIYLGKCCVIPFVKKMPAIEHFEALVLMFKTVKTPPTVKSP
jgi:hypothetical protein